MNRINFKKVLIIGALSAFSAHSFASELTFPEFVESCKNPANYGHQRPPQNIRVACKDIKKTWEPIESG